MPASRININLLPSDKWEKTPTGKFLQWVLTYGRYIVIGTELIVLLAFLSRFKLDRDLSDLSESVKTKRAVVENSQVLENDVRSLQARLAKIDGLLKGQVSFRENLGALTPLVPADVIFDDLSISSKQVGISGKTSSLNTLSAFLRNLLLSKKFTEVSLDKITAQEEGELIFTLTAQLKKEDK